jgi:hypothetical protein
MQKNHCQCETLHEAMYWDVYHEIEMFVVAFLQNYSDKIVKQSKSK